jgi:outer membrane protein assembly factor BamB
MQRKTTYITPADLAGYIHRLALLTVTVTSFFYFSSGASAISAELVWVAKTGAAISDSPLIVNERIYAASADKHLYCWDVISGKRLWKTRFKQRLYYSPVYSDGYILVVEPFSTGKIHAVDSITGDKKWSAKIGKRILKPVILEGKVIVASGKQLVALRTGDGSVVERAVATNNISSLTAWNGYLVAVTITGDLDIYDSGLEFVRNIPFGPGGVFLDSSDGFLYGTVSTGTTFKMTKEFEIAWENEYGLPAFRNPIASGGYVYSVTESGLIPVHSNDTGEPVAEIEISGNLFSYSVFSNGLILISESGSIHYIIGDALQKVECEDTGIRCYTPILPFGDNIFFSDSIGFLYKYRIKM